MFNNNNIDLVPLGRCVAEDLLHDLSQVALRALLRPRTDMHEHNRLAMQAELPGVVMPEDFVSVPFKADTNTALLSHAQFR
eukprot:CAMPEP_0175862926 /NCGR_PEP_ID=MMETSP0107_2-20121207/32215_1 /TAXON_ID=195067 ORGANISM="Goniomonas pacifica, Strain CCMP1869" /NCGR_SAMPLE_ID=MMETSP0107_2 /ASSEMBLY_ACC=CAM_ASM_000203 /LENGTH=80 /DNA_ID=CAMNT_0017179977 /DNA_START=229 /DNA_END=471 /DNA_ORIENTATION=-